MTTIGSLFTGYGGLDLAVENVFSACTAWVSDIESGPQAVLAHRFPDARQLGDITTVDWGDVEPVDIITGGSPCQDISAAGRRAGMTDGTRSNLWAQMREAIRVLRPSLVIWENVRGAHSARATSDMELEPGRVGGPDSGPFLRATGRVLGDLSGLGFDAEWVTLPASAVGAPHKRERVFVLAWRRDAGAPHALRSGGWRWSDESGAGPAGGAHASIDGAGHRPDPSRSTAAVTLLSTPESYAGSRGGSQHPSKRRSGGHAVSVADVAEHELPPRGGDADFGVYSPAIQRWEAIIGRPAPAPTSPGQKGRPRLSAAFTEWMMGLPAGWVTDPALGLSRVQQLRLLGNGVVPQQAEHSLRLMLARSRRAGDERKW